MSYKVDTPHSHIGVVIVTSTGKEKIVGVYKVCVDASGHVAAVSTLKATGFAAYDNKITTSMRAWSFKPFLINGKPTPVCTAATYIYMRH